MLHKSLYDLRKQLRKNYLKDEKVAIEHLSEIANMSVVNRQTVAQRGAALVTHVRDGVKPSLMEAFLAEYGLSTKEGIALMCLAETLLRVPDAGTMDDLIEDKIMGGDWGAHAGQSISQLVNASTMGLQVTNAILNESSKGATSAMRSMVKRLGMPIIRAAVQQVMKELGRQFVLGQDMKEAQKQASKFEIEGYTYSYDMLGEAAHTAADAEVYFQAYVSAIKSMAVSSKREVHSRPGISVKLSALHPRYEQNNVVRVMAELCPKVLVLAKLAAKANIGFNIDAEEADRLDLSLSVIEDVLSSDGLKGWDGFGVVVQAYGKRAPDTIKWLYQLATSLDRKITVRLVKGAYWDTEIKRAQVMGLKDFPVFTKKAHSDISYIACAKMLFGMMDRIYPQFATHNAHSVAAVLQFSKGISKDKFEFQRLHGMGESLHSVLRREESTQCRIYAPVGIHRDLLAYLVRRLLENGANSSFVNQIVDTAIAPSIVAVDPFESATSHSGIPIKTPATIFGDDRMNSRGWDVTDPTDMAIIDAGRTLFSDTQWHAEALMASPQQKPDQMQTIKNPADPTDIVGTALLANEEDVATAFSDAKKGLKHWAGLSVDTRAQCLERAADLLEESALELFALLTREAGKSLPDGISELREAVDFLRFYACEARRQDAQQNNMAPRGIFICISPWNFPLAIFLGQISAALVTGNVVLAKPAEQTPLIAARAVELLLKAGVPSTALQLLSGDGPTIGAALTSHKDVAGVCFTGSTATAQTINRAMAKNCTPSAPLVAETGGLNAMIVDSTALPEQAVQDIIESAFQSAGQRCSALRMLYIQEDVKERFLTMLYGAMDELAIGNPWDIACDVGPVIDSEAQDTIQSYCLDMEAEGRLLKRVEIPSFGRFAAPCVIKVSGIEELQREIFGPVLHVATFKAEEITNVVKAINDQGYGLTMGLHTRIDERVDLVRSAATVGNLYINRNQIGAVVGCQPFGGEGLSGTGPKAGGPNYLDVFMTDINPPETGSQTSIASVNTLALRQAVEEAKASSSVEVKVTRRQLVSQFCTYFSEYSDLIEKLFIRLDNGEYDTQLMPSPVGENNELSAHARGIILCQSNDLKTQLYHVVQALYFGNKVIISGELSDRFKPLESPSIYIVEGAISAKELGAVNGISAFALSANENKLRAMRVVLAGRDGQIVPLITEFYAPYRYMVERHCCIDTTASGGDVELLKGGTVKVS